MIRRLNGIFRLVTLATAVAAVASLNPSDAEAIVLHRRAALSGHHGCDPCAPPQTICLTACHPCTGCPVEIKLCVPACCEGMPTVCSRPTLIGSGLIRYDWCCGFSAIVRFDRCGNYRVFYRG